MSDYCNEKECPMLDRIVVLEKDSDKTQKDMEVMNKDFTDIRIEQAENKVYVKQIFEQLSDLKILIKSNRTKDERQSEQVNKTWQPVVLKLIEVIGTVITLLAGIIGYAKIIGRG